MSCLYMATGTLACSPSTRAGVSANLPCDDALLHDSMQSRINSSMLLHAVDERAVAVPYIPYCKPMVHAQPRTQ